MAPTYELKLFGPIQVLDREGRDILTGTCGEKAKGLLAILAIYGDRPCSRAMLQDKLWSDRGEQQARNSLRQALSQLRRMFRQDAKRILLTDGGPVLLARDHLKIDYFDPDVNAASRREFLEGIDIKDPQFNIWLSEMRVNSEGSDARPTVSHTSGTDCENGPRLSLGILPVLTSVNDDTAKLVANLVIDKIATNLRYYEVFDIHDFRDVAAAGARPADLFLKVQALSLGAATSLSFKIFKVENQFVIWSKQRQLETASLATELLSEMTAQLVDEICNKLLHSGLGGMTAEREAARNLIEGVDRLMRRSERSLAEATHALEKACDLQPKASYFAWSAYSSAHLLEAKVLDLNEIRARADFWAARAIEADPHNPLARSLLSHVYSFVFRDFGRAAALIAPLQSDPPDLALYHYAKGTLACYTGDYDTAKVAAARAVRFGRDSPYQYLFGSLRQMAHSLSGSFEKAIQYGTRSLSQQIPGTQPFLPTLRYLAANYAQSGDLVSAAATYRRIEKRDPGFTWRRLEDPAAPVPADHVRRFLISGLRTAEKAAS
ncbi:MULTISPECIES: winged helix-turn-helix domain-containing protein [unclassified Mameliella]|uniref:winged helix-turn-helix domain-containing protein n=1 Tax=unclassified Mameliella TaxID=2630630 RepID=UPI00273D1436|nr:MULTISPECIES: winged helix-turn-helix domain-containing protein [unclassified Mameliella]